MNRSKKTRIVSLLALVLCIAMAAVFAFAFAGCDDESATADSKIYLYPGSEFVSAGLCTVNDKGEKVFDELPEVAYSEVVETVRVENDAVATTSEPDENGVSTCTVAGWGDYYLSPGGSVCAGYPLSYTLAPISMTADEPEIQVSLIFNGNEIIDGRCKTPLRKDEYFCDACYIESVEVSSLIGGPLEVASITFKTEVLYEYLPGEEDLYAGDLIAVLNEDSRTNYPLESEISKDANSAATTVKTYYATYITHGYNVIRVELENSDVYCYGVKLVDDHVMDLVLLKDDEEAEEDIEGDEDIDEDVLSSLA